MENCRRLLEIHRMSFNRFYEAISKAMQLADPDINEVRGNWVLLEQKKDSIAEIDKQMLNLLLESNCTEEEIDSQVEIADQLMAKYNKLKFDIEQLIDKKRSSSSNTCYDNGSTHSCNSQSKLKLPKIEFQKFGGEIKDWLPFWSQFKRIDEDESIKNEDKFQYLFQATIPRSRARQLLESYPPSAENYSKVIESLKSRFGRDDMLVEFYIRELLKLVLNNMNNRTKLSILFDKLEAQLRALETLGITKEKCAALLFPLVESCLPEEILRAWQRNPSYSSNSDSKYRLENMIEFLRKEVENEERINLAVSGFDCPNDKKKIYFHKEERVPTAMGLVNHDRVLKCVFCKGEHKNYNCEEAKTMSLSDKRAMLSSKGSCHRCLKFGHISRRCGVKVECKVCKGRHATLMCWKNESSNEDEHPQPSSSVSNKSTAVENLSNNTYQDVFLQTLVVQLNGIWKFRNIRVLIDSGSQRSYINRITADEMGYESIKQETMIHSLFGGSQTENTSHNCYKIRLSNPDRNYSCQFEALDQHIICNNVISIKEGPWISELKSLGITINDTQDGPIEVLIGADIAGKLLTGQKRELRCGLVAVETSLGWTVMGKVSLSSRYISKSATMIVTSLFSKNIPLADLWDMEVLGIIDPVVEKNKEENAKAVMSYFLETLERDKDGRYNVSLPWIEGHPILPNNYHLAKSRLENLWKKLDKDGYRREYNQVFQEWLKEGVIEEVSYTESEFGVNYLPHHHVIKLNSSTTKLRPVFDASSKMNKDQPSLNQCLEKGLNLIELIPSILNRFRMSRIGVVSDIRRAFLQIGLKENDRNYLRFLWYDGNNHLKIYRHARVVFGVSCSPFLLGAVLEYHLKIIRNNIYSGCSRYSLHYIDKLLRSFYVDNCVASVDNATELQEFMEQSTLALNEAKFELRGWEHTLLLNGDEIHMTPVLGINWNRTTDTLELNLDGLQNISLDNITKRIILSVVNRIFDPIGFTSPVLLVPKLLLQKTWQSKIGWDSELPTDIKESFLNWLRTVNQLTNLKIPRWLLNVSENDITNWSLHLFCDASKNSYASVIFLRAEYSQGVSVQLIQAKSRISPLRKISIPRLELLAATIGVRLLISVLKNFENQNVPIFCWTDSTTVLAWIKQTEVWKPFVWNRIQEIRKFTRTDSWNYVPGLMNPADLPSRGCSISHLITSKWWEGPVWLYGSNWPNQDYVVDKESVLEEKRMSVSLFSTKIDFSWYYRYFSKYQKILRLIAWVKRFRFNVTHKDNRKNGNLCSEEIEEAEQKVLWLIQKECFRGVEDERFSSLYPFKDETGILRLKTKVSERDDATNFRFPALLPSNHRVVFRIIYDQHIRNCHVGTQGLLNILRENFWILGGRKTIRKVISKCIICQKNIAKSLLMPSPPLPRDRVRDAAVFEICGVDLFGPFYLRAQGKVWVSIFTCAVYRAIHLEVVTSLSAESFIQAFRKFIARRGRPLTMYSDNGSNFVGLQNVLATLDWKKIADFSSVEKIRWKFSPPQSPWWGGWWERLIRMIKQLLRKVLGRAALNIEDLSTILCDCEAVVNSRPLTYLPDNDNEMVALTPSMFLLDVKEVGVPDLDKIEATYFRRRFRYRQKLKEDLRNRFRIEYLSQLSMKRNKLCSKRVKVGDMVLIENDKKNRIGWPLARIVELFPGKDNEVRLVRLKTVSGFLLRTIQKIYPLEVDEGDNNTLTEVSRKSNMEECVPEGSNKTTRCGRVVKRPARYDLEKN